MSKYETSKAEMIKTIERLVNGVDEVTLHRVMLILARAWSKTEG